MEENPPPKKKLGTTKVLLCIRIWNGCLFYKEMESTSQVPKKKKKDISSTRKQRGHFLYKTTEKTSPMEETNDANQSTSWLI